MSSSTVPALILASKSSARRSLLESAGLRFDQQAAEVDERAVELPLLAAGMSTSDIADVLAQAKALDVSARNKDVFVIGADQTMSFIENGEEKRFDKPNDMDAARRQLLALRGRQHTLHAAVCVVKNNELIWSYSSDAHLTMRDFSPAFVGQYLADV